MNAWLRKQKLDRMTPNQTASRIAWIDYAKGLCIILVVMMHTVNGYEGMAGAEGWLRPVVDFARPFRMPDFFLISGLFLSRTLHGPVLDYFDRKLVHFVYFYVLWLAIQMPILEADILFQHPMYFLKLCMIALFEPTNTLWFVHMLAVFYVVTWLLRSVPKLLVLGAAIGLQTLYQYGYVDTGWDVADRFCNRYIYFYLGYAGAPYIFQFADYLSSRLWLVLPALPVWAVFNWFAVEAGLHDGPGSSLALGFAGAIAVCAISATLARFQLATLLRYTGQFSIVVYLTFFFPMKVMSRVFDQFGDPFGSIGLSSAIILAIAVITPLIFHRMIKDTPLNFLYTRPDWLKLDMLMPKQKTISAPS
ncbi:MAG: acyltransferase family protein [Henriciella sp.]